MTKDCLQTKLKGIVQNDNLKKLGVFTLQINVTSTSEKYYIHSYENNSSLFTIVSGPANGEIIKYGAGSLGTSFYLDNDLWNYTFSETGVYTIEISNKYNIKDLQLAGACSFDISELEHTPFSTIVATGSGITGSIDKLNTEEARIVNLQYCPNLEGGISCFDGASHLVTLALNASPNITGDIASVTSCASLSNLQIATTKVSGTVASLIDNGSLKNPLLNTFVANDTPQLTKDSTDIETLRNLGVTVVVQNS